MPSRYAATSAALAAALLLTLAQPAAAAKKPQQPDIVKAEEDPAPDPAVRKQLAMNLQAQGKYKMAWEMLLPLAEAGDTEAAYQMGWLSETGWPGAEGDPELAAPWYRRAAQGGHVQAQLWLGYHYAGKMASDTEHISEGIEWLVKAADADNQEAQMMLGDIYASGRGLIPKDRGISRYWLGRAAAQGNAMAQIMLRSK